MTKRTYSEGKQAITLMLPVSLHRRLQDMKYNNRESATAIIMRGIEHELALHEKRAETLKENAQ